MLKVGIIGCGSIAKQRHGYEYFHNSDVEIKGFYDLIPERAQALVDLYGGKVYAGVDELLADPESTRFPCVWPMRFTPRSASRR